MSRKNAIIVIVFILCVAVILGFYLIVLGGLPPAMRGIVPQPEPQEPQKVICPLTGVETNLDEGMVPFAVAIDNIRQARPQSGLDRADIIYEVLAEGGIPRFLAFYYCGGESDRRIGPVRSARTYFISLAKQFDAVLVHAGGSPEALRQIQESEIRSLNQFQFPKAYFRDPARRRPHNLFTNTSRLLNAAEEAGYTGPDTIEGPAFGTNDSTGSEARTVAVPYPTTRVTYEYDPQTGTYARSMNGSPHRDGVTGEQLRAKNVVVQFAQQRVTDAAGRLEITLLGSGRAIFFINGMRIDGQWTRESETETFTYLDESGATVKLAPGQTWVEVVRPGTRITDGQ